MSKTFLIAIYNRVFKILAGHGIGKPLPIRAVNRFILSRLKSPMAEVGGHKMFLDSMDSLRLSIRSVYEPLVTEVVKKEIKKGDIVLDIGAHIGYYTLTFAKIVGEEGKVYAFEPEPTNFSLLKKNVEINGYKNVVLLEKAVSNENGKIRLYLSKSNTVDHKTYDSHDGRRCIEIESIKLDDFCKNNDGRIDFIKMDIQGAEARALQGMANILKRNNDMKMVMEFCPSKLKESGTPPEECLKLLTETGFRLYEIIERKKKIIPVNIHEFLKVYTAEKENSTNLLCLREERK
jgi:FkbM family methyltransferase